MLRNSGLLICGVVLAAVLVNGSGACASGHGKQKNLWKQRSGVATETIFLRRTVRPLFSEEDLPVLSAGDLIRTRPFLHLETASMTLFVREGASDTLELYPGSILAVEKKSVRLDLGRLRLVASGSPGLVLDLRRAMLELPAGEALAEVDPRGNVRLALERGSGWVKLADRRIIMLAPGKQIEIPRYGTPGQPSETGHIWNTPPEFWLMPRPAAEVPSETVSEETETASDASLIASNTVQTASGSDTASATAVSTEPAASVSLAIPEP
ncbi:MAG TPA: hypothetical protein PKM25_17125 [Candidatus Ozemobacteraceae bacterium]|nr:hypothetical protein [Candidatus Ozemobacteraceae bacterium]